MEIYEFNTNDNREYSSQEILEIFDTHQKIILLGNYCQVTWESPKKTYSSKEWKLYPQNHEIEIFNTNIQIKDTILKHQNIQDLDLYFEQICDSFFDTPNILFLDIYSSFPLVWRWVEMRDYAIRLGKCFFEEKTKYDPLLKDLENGFLTQHEYDCIWLEYNSIKVLFDLLGDYYQEFKEVLFKNYDEYPFNSMIDLFRECIQDRFNKLFSRYLKKKCVVNQNQQHRLTCLNLKKYQRKLTYKQEKEFKKLSQNNTVSSFWETRVIQAAETLYKQGLTEIGSYIKEDEDILYELHKKIYRVECNPSSFNERNPQSETWEKGFFTPGIKN